MKSPKINTSPPNNVTFYDRTTSDILKITEDKLKLKLNHLKKSIENKTYIFCYLGIIITILLALLTSNFKDFIFNKELWKSIFIVSIILLTILFARSIILFSKNKRDIESIIKDIKNNI